MAVTEFGNSSAQNVNIWSKTTMREALKGTYFFKKFLGKDEYSIIQRITDLEKSAGDTVKYDLLMQMRVLVSRAIIGFRATKRP